MSSFIKQKQKKRKEKRIMLRKVEILKLVALLNTMYVRNMFELPKIKRLWKYILMKNRRASKNFTSYN
jgi:hypothetical protein